MLVSFDHDLIFIKTGKTAGTSVEMFLQQACGLSDGVPPESTPAIVSPRGIVGRRMHARPPFWRQDKWYNHMPATLIRQRLGDATWNRCSRVTTVRNPYDRLISGMTWRKHEALGTVIDDLPALRETVEDFVLNGGFGDDRDKLFDNGTFAPHHCIRFENLQDDLAQVCATLGIDTTGVSLPRTKVRRQNRQGRALAEFFTPRAISAMQRKYDWAFDRFGYPDHPEAADQMPQALITTIGQTECVHAKH